MNFTVYRSSAGSGKTFTLVKEYLKIALSDEHENPFKFKKILAITFTNKAAQEMKDRVIRALKELSAPVSGELSPLTKILVTELNLDPITLASRAENLLRAILHNYSDFAISTIDSFTHRIVRSFAYDLGLPLNFEVETEKDELLQQAVDKLMSMIGTDKGITNTLIRFSEEKTDAEKGWQIENDLKATAEYLLQESGTLYAQRLRELSLDDFTEIRNRLFHLTGELENKITLLSQKALDLIKSSGLDDGDFYQGRSGISVWFTKVNSCHFDALAKPNSYVTKTIEEDNWLSGQSKKNGNDKIILEIAPSLKEIYRQIQDYVNEHYSIYISRNAIRRHLYSLAVLNELEKIIRELRDEESRVHISEFNHIISKVVAEQPVPYIFEKLGARYSHFLVDEFQDTSVLQWENLLPLLENGLAENNFSMVVGDAKQAIYRWRSGDVEQFVNLPKLVKRDDNVLMKDREQSLIRHYREEELSKNFRSKEEIVGFNNRLFLSLAEMLSDHYNNIYKRVEQEIKSGNEGGYVELRFPDREGYKDEVYEEYTHEAVVLVQQLISEGWQKNEIALLVRENKQGSLLARALIEEGIPVLSSDSLLIKNSPLVCCVVSLLRALEHPEDKIALTDVAEFLNKSGRANFALHEINRKKLSLNDVLKSVGIDDDLAWISVLPIYQQCESIVRAVFPNEQKNAWIVFFLDELLRFSASRNPDRQSFFSWWEDRSRNASVVIPEGTDAVHIMTIHKSKGLEFPVVILPYLDWKRKATTKELWVDYEDAEIPNLKVALVSQTKDLRESTLAEQYNLETDKQVLDQMNVLYVACTRAVDQLYVLSESPSKAKSRDENSEDPTNVVKWLHKLFANNLSEDKIVSYGTKQQPVRDTKEKQESEFIPLSAGEGKWTGKIRVRKYSEDSWSDSAEPSAKENGIVLHNLLRRIKSENDIESVVGSAVNSGLISSANAGTITSMLLAVVSHKSLAAYFSEEFRNYSETDILVPGDRSSRPDRVIVRGDEAIVLEYKSGAQSNDHINQVKHYKSLLERMGYKNIGGKLIYLDPLKIVDI